MEILEQLKQYTEQRCVIGNVTFSFRKAKVFEAFRIADKIREELAKVAIEDVVKQGAGTELDLILGLAKVRSAFVQDMCSEMFPYVHFKDGTGDAMVLAGNEDRAFSKLQLTDMYLVLVRSLAVNFFDTFKGLLLGSQQEAQE